ncbi:hypothetical protein P2H44_25240 [Albimonas sp. CAU 1670]|uniref:trypsin-like serine peptidase n=1 Tax=Albimonas sp. CAU 1670 TaxID=3032599 RepID=UPI0023DBB381|nr:hypothetical protein [Albimonas sp. CAU 1670]MDF2235871.1 hypothetical protein [Albimonas sp. CAU 1670]
MKSLATTLTLLAGAAGCGSETPYVGPGHLAAPASASAATNAAPAPPPLLLVAQLRYGGELRCHAVVTERRAALTAAHCVHADDGELLGLDGFTLVADGRFTGIEAILPDADFDPVALAGADTVAADRARLLLTQPLPVAPMRIGWEPHAGHVVEIALPAGRRIAPCRVLRDDARVFALDCPVAQGVSGAPVVAVVDGVPEIVGLVSAREHDPMVAGAIVARIRNEADLAAGGWTR